MSRAYRVKWQTASRVVRSEDQVKLDVDLLGILPPEEMHELLAGALTEEGWKKKGDGTLAKTMGAAEATLSEDGKTISLNLKQKKKVTATAQTKSTAESEAARRSQAAQAGLDEERTRALSQAEADLRDGLSAVVQRTYREALERRARMLGEIESIQEGTTTDGDVEVTIKIKA